MKKLVIVVLVLLMSFSLFANGAAEGGSTTKGPNGYPKKDITMIVPLTAGGAFDQCARKLAAIVNEMYGINIVVQNIEGGGGLTGMTQVFTSKPDGYTLAFYSASFPGQSILGLNNLPLDAFTPIVAVQEESQIICVNSKSPYQTFDDLVAAIKANPGKITMATPGSLNSQQVGVRMLSEQIFGPGQFDGIVSMGYAGGARICADLIGESIIDSGILKSSEIYSAYMAGEVRPLVVVGPERLSLCPDVPTLTELGWQFIPTFSGILNTTAIYAPKGTDQAIIDYLGEILRAGVLSEEFKAYAASLDAKASGITGAELQELYKTDIIAAYESYRDIYLKGLL